MHEWLPWFPESYEASRVRFRQSIEYVRQYWPGAQLHAHRVNNAEDLTIDWISVDPLEHHNRLLVFTLGEHGIEAFTGAAMLQLFLTEFLAWLNPADSGLLLVHALNPWGMRHLRRANGNNVDLNRNFVRSEHELDPALNPDYVQFAPIFHPQGPLRHVHWNALLLTLRLLMAAGRVGVSGLRKASTLGQYRFPRGIYYGGEVVQAETELLKRLYRTVLGQYAQVVFLDMHSGYGPSDQMSLVNSPSEPRSSQLLAEQFGYPLVVQTTPDEFYSIHGDMIDDVYALAQAEFPQLRLYATTFEFGTFGDSSAAALRSLRAQIMENQLFWFGAGDHRAQAYLQAEYGSLFNPSDESWRAKAVTDARQAIAGILHAEGFVDFEQGHVSRS